MNQRIFIAVFPPSDAIEKIIKIQQRLHSLLSDRDDTSLRWVHRENLHSTLQFLGEQSEPVIARIYSGISVICRSTPEFVVSFDRIGYFPFNGKPKTVWVGSGAEDNEIFSDFSSKIRQVTGSAGIIEAENSFYPHITIGRKKGKRNRNLIQKLETVTFHPIQFVCSEVYIMKSTISSTGSTYTTLFTIPLK